MPKIISLFSGAGGLDEGFRLAQKNYKLIFANEILSAPAKTFAKNFSAKYIDNYIKLRAENLPLREPVIIKDSVENLKFEELSEVFERPDIILGGPPCQDFSVLRGKNGKGIEVQRGKLYSYFVKSLAHFQPKIFVFENVPGLISANGGMAYKTIINDFENLTESYDSIKTELGNHIYKENIKKYKLIFNDVVNFSYLGVPQIRKRLIIIGVREDLLNSAGYEKVDKLKKSIKKVLKGSEKHFNIFPLTPIEVFEGDVLINLNKKYERIMKEYEDLFDKNKSKLAQKWKKEIWDKLTFDIKKDYMFFNNVPDSFEDEFDLAMKEHEEVLKLLGYYGNPVKIEKDSKMDTDKVLMRMYLIPPGGNYEFVEDHGLKVKGLMSNIYRRINPLVPAPAVIAYGGGGTWGYHYERSRGKLTNKERARLQTFPEKFSFEGNSQEVRAQIGEAVPPLGAYYIAKAVNKIIENLDLLESKIVYFW